MSNKLVDGLNLESQITTLKPIRLLMDGLQYNLKSEFDVVYEILERFQKAKELTLRDKLIVYGFKFYASSEIFNTFIFDQYKYNNITVNLYQNKYEVYSVDVENNKLNFLKGCINNHEQLFADIEFLEKRKVL